jgi:hypothetical protein
MTKIRNKKYQIFLFYHLDEIMKNEVHCRYIEFYLMLTNSNENQYPKQSNIDPMSKKNIFEKKNQSNITESLAIVVA